MGRASFFRVHPMGRGRLTPTVTPIWLTPEHAIPVLAMVAATATVPILCLAPDALPRLGQLREEKARTVQQIHNISKEIQELRVKAERVRTNPAAVEQVARDELGLVRQTELVFQFVD